MASSLNSTIHSALESLQSMQIPEASNPTSDLGAILSNTTNYVLSSFRSEEALSSVSSDLDPTSLKEAKAKETRSEKDEQVVSMTEKNGLRAPVAVHLV